MTFEHKGQPFSIPDHLKDISLSQWIGFYNQYGRELDKRYAYIQGMPEGPDRADAYLLYEVDLAIQHYSYYSGVPLLEVMEMSPMDVVVQMNTILIHLKMEESELDYHVLFDFNNEWYRIQPVIEVSDKLTNEQFEKTQSVALIYSDLQDGKQEALYNLCAAFLRKENEPFSDSLVDDAGERVELMKSLPLNIALCVEKYIQDTITVYLQTIK